MSAKSYNPVQSDYKFIDIIEYMLQQTGPVSGTQIAKALGIPHPTVMSHMVVALDRKWIKHATGELYEPGLRLMGMYSAYKVGLANRIDTLQSELNKLEG